MIKSNETPRFILGDPDPALFHIEQLGERTFTTSNSDALVTLLIAHGFSPVPISKSAYESARLGRCNWPDPLTEIVILYRSGSIVATGRDWWRVARLVKRFCRISARAALWQNTIFDEDPTIHGICRCGTECDPENFLTLGLFVCDLCWPALLATAEDASDIEVQK